MTVSLAVLGKYVPSLGFFATFLNEDIELDPGVRFYQRLLGADQDGAMTVVDDVLKEKPRAEVFDEVIIPTLSLAERDHARDEIDDRELAFIHRVVANVLDDLADEPEVNLTTLSTDAQGVIPSSPSDPTAAPIKILALPAHDETDALVLRLLDLLLMPTGVSMTIGDPGASPLAVVDRIEEDQPDLVLISHLPPDGLTATRYLTRRIRARFPRLAIAVGRWDHDSEADAATTSLTQAGANSVFNSLADAREFLVKQPKTTKEVAHEVLDHAKA